jgi:hypothetical protein
LGESERAKRQKQLLQTVRAELAGCSESVLLAAQKLIHVGAAAEPDMQLPRGVKQLGGNGSTSVPKYLKIKVLAEVCGLVSGILNKMNNMDIDNAFLFSIGLANQTCSLLLRKEWATQVLRHDSSRSTSIWGSSSNI